MLRILNFFYIYTIFILYNNLYILYNSHLIYTLKQISFIYLKLSHSFLNIDNYKEASKIRKADLLSDIKVPLNKINTLSSRECTGNKYIRMYLTQLYIR